MRTLVMVAAFLAFSAVAADKQDKVYKWVDKSGTVHYENKPQHEGDAPAHLPPLQTYKGAPPDLSKYAAPAPEQKAPAGGGSGPVNILSPAADETFRDTDQSVAVAVEVPGGLNGAKLTYYLDGGVNGGPTDSTTFSLTNVERGSHTVTVALVKDGQELGRSRPVTFHMKPPATKAAQPTQPKAH